MKKKNLIVSLICVALVVVIVIYFGKAYSASSVITAEQNAQKNKAYLPEYTILEEKSHPGIRNKEWESFQVYVAHKEKDITKKQLEKIMLEEINRLRKYQRTIMVFVYDYYRYPNAYGYSNNLYSSSAFVSFGGVELDEKPKVKYASCEVLDTSYRASKELRNY